MAFARSADGTSLFYEKRGRGRPLVLCDGLLCEGHVWKYLIPDMERGLEIVHWNYPGHGKSGEPPRFSDLSPARLADDLAAVARNAALERVTAVGHSFGVQVCIEAFRRHPDLVEALILICGSQGNLVSNFHDSPVLGYLVPLLDAIGRFMPRISSTLWRKAPLKRFLGIAMHSRAVDSRLINASDIEQYLSRLNRVDLRVALGMLKSAERHDATPYLNDIDAPVLIIAGGKDSFTPAWRSERMAAAIPRAELMMVPSGTHSLPIEQPDLVNLKIRRFLTGAP